MGDLHSDSTDIVAAIRKEADRIVEDSTYSAKGHFEAAKSWREWHFRIGVPTAIAAAIAGISAINDFPILAAVLAFAVAAASGLSTFLDAKGNAAAHLHAGNAYKALQSDTRIFEEVDCKSGLSVQELRKRLGDLNARRSELNANSPQIPKAAFENARHGIEEGEAQYRVD
jgi:hypothetical protein